ncbi:hypothetical protein FACS1894163_01530 [Spirochaetia bacterium]|nr:hypothetical protein FACS1894163_01530 [Spirochaetia bacterium]
MAIKFLAANLGKIITAGMMALFVLTIFCLVYYNIPVHVTSKSGTTDYVWEKYAYYSKMTEGFGTGRMNNEGFNNLEDYNAQSIDILLMGSSQMEGTNVIQTKTTVSVLNNLMNQKYCYNIGISGHSLPHIVTNLETAIQYYTPDKYVVIETMSIQFNTKSLGDIIESKVQRIPSYDSGIIFHLQKIPYLRLLYKQYKDLRGHNEDEIQEQVPDVLDKDQYSILLDTVMRRINQISINNNIKPILFYHPHLTLNKDGSASANTNNEYLDAFKAACINNGIYFFDMTAVFMEEYQTNHILPHGFANTAVGAGHLNKNGHRIIANELFRRINEIEKGGSL